MLVDKIIQIIPSAFEDFREVSRCCEGTKRQICTTSSLGAAGVIGAAAGGGGGPIQLAQTSMMPAGIVLLMLLTAAPCLLFGQNAHLNVPRTVDRRNRKFSIFLPIRCVSAVAVLLDH